MKPTISVLPLLLGLFALLGAGCVSYEDDAQPSERRAAATLLTVVDESHQLTPEQMADRRREIVSYLVAEGYIYSGEDLVQSASYADQIIRAKLAPDGSFELTIYRPERLAHHEVAFDPAGYPVYTYFPGDIGYFGNGFDPYYLPIAPYYGPRHPHYRPGSHRGHDGPRPDRPRPPGQRPDWNHGQRPDRDNGHPGTPPPGGKPRRDRDRDHRPDRPDPTEPGQPPRDPVPPPPATPTPTPPPPAQPNPRPNGPDRQPWVRHPAPPANTTSNPPAPQNRTRPAGAPARVAPPPRVNPPPRPAPPPQVTPEPAKEQPTNTDAAPSPSEINSNGRLRENRR